MDDCNLDKLSVKPGKLLPVFHKDNLEYNATVGSEVEHITFDCLTSDTGACYSISVRKLTCCQGRQPRLSIAILLTTPAGPPALTINAHFTTLA